MAVGSPFCQVPLPNRVGHTWALRLGTGSLIAPVGGSLLRHRPSHCSGLRVSSFGRTRAGAGAEREGDSQGRTLGCLLRPLLPLSGSSGFPGCVRILNKKGKARSKLIFQHRAEMLFPASYKTGANKTDTGAHCPTDNVVMGDRRLRKQTSGRRERLIFPHECECECARARV